jgi:hypothetical protein
MKRWRLAGLITVCLLTLGVVLIRGDTTDLVPPILPEVQKKVVVPPKYEPLIPPDLPPVDRKRIAPREEMPLTPPQLPGIERRSVQPPQVAFLEIPQLPEVGWPEVREFKDFKGGLDLSTCKTKVPPDRAIVLENALWNEQGEMYKRPGYSEHSTPPFNPNFLYRYYKQDGKKFTMGGSDTSLHFWHEDSSGDGWTYLMNTGGYTGRWDGCTFEDMFIGAHEGISPIAWDGFTLINVGEQSYSYDSSWAANCSLYVHVENVAWDDNQFVGFYAVQDSASCSDSGMPFGQIVRNTLDVFTIRYNATSGTNPWGADQNVTLLSALEDSVWAAGIIDTFYSMGGHQSEVLVPGVDTIRAEWTAVPAGSLYINISDYPDTTSHDDYCYTDDTTSVMIVGFGDHTSALTDIDRIWLNIIASNNIDQEIGTAIYVVVRLCHPDTTNYFSYLWQVNQGLENFPYSKKYTRFRVPLPTTPRGHVWTDEGLDSLMLYLMATNRAEGNFGFGDQRLEVFDAWIGVDYEQYNVACGFMVYDSSLFDDEGLLDNDMTVPTYFELIPEGYDGTPGSPSKTTRQIIDIDSGIYTSPVWGNLAYLKLAEPEISGLAVGDSFQLKHLYFPTSKFVENFDARLWLGWTGTGADQNKNVVLYSALSDIANWPPGNEIYIESDDGDYITGMTQFYPDQQGHRSEPWAELVVSKEQSLYRVYPTTFAGELDYNTMFISRGVGCCSNSAMAMIEGKFIAFPDQHGVWLYNGTGVQPISLLIDPIFEDLALANLEDMSAIYNPQDRHYYISYPDTYTVDPQDSSELDKVYCIVTFEDDRDGNWGCYAQRYDINMDPIDTNFRVDDDETATDQEDPNVTIDGQERWIFAWGDERYSSPSYDVRIRRFANDGIPLDSSIQVNEDSEYSHWMPDVAANLHGVFVVVWEDERTPGSTDIYAQRFDSAGNAIGGNFLVDTCTARCREPEVEIANDGKFVISWFVDATTVFHEVFFQRYDSAGNAVGANEGILDTEPYDLGSFLSMSMNQANGTFVISWSRNEQQYGTYDIWAQRLDSAGTALGTNFKVNDDATNYTQEQPGVAMNSDGKFIISMDDWRDYAIDGFGDIYLQRYDSGAVASGANIKISTQDTVAEVKYNSSDMDASGAFMVAWCSYWDVGDSIDILARHFSSEGTPTTDAFRVNDSVSVVRSTERNEVCVNPYCALSAHVETSTVNNKTLAWNIDYHGWSQETFSASAYAYQHGLTDPVKVIFADPEETKVYNYGTQADDVNDAVILTYQSPYLSFVQNPSWDVVMSYATLEAFLDTGEVYVYWYKDYSELVHVDTISCGGDCRKEIQLPPWDVTGHNISMKIITGAEIDDFTLSGYWWEYLINRWRN